MNNKRKIAIFGGGTTQWIANHLALSAPYYGGTARALYSMCKTQWPEVDPQLCLTKLALDSSDRNSFEVFDDFWLDSNEDVERAVDHFVNDSMTKAIFFSTAMLDYHATIPDHQKKMSDHGKNGIRISTRKHPQIDASLIATPKVISKIRKERKDLFLVGFKQTSGFTKDEQYIAGLELCKEASCNLVLANDQQSRVNMIVTPEEARYHVTKDRDEALMNLVEMTKLRSHLTFTRSTVIAGDPVPWSSSDVPESLRTVVDFCISSGAYKPFKGVTVGHFAVKLNDTTFLTSRRRTNFNDLAEIGLVKIETDGPDTVIAHGSKPSVGGQSQRIIFSDHPEMDCVAHFHCEIKEGSKVPVASQRENECGSHQCGKKTSDGLKQFGNLKAVYLDNHGPNIVFHRSIDPQEVINFIKENFDLESKTGGLVTL